jgi:hypothetical protein
MPPSEHHAEKTHAPNMEKISHPVLYLERQIFSSPHFRDYSEIIPDVFHALR